MDYTLFYGGFILSLIGLGILVWNNKIIKRFLKVESDLENFYKIVIISGGLLTLIGGIWFFLSSF